MQKIFCLCVLIFMGLHSAAQSTDAIKKALNEEIEAATKKVKDAQKKLSDLTLVQEPADNPETVAGNQIYHYRAAVLSTNFTIPILRVNFLAPAASAAQNARASASFFNSIGAGIGYYFGSLDRTLDSEHHLVTQSMTNIFGIQVGCLFASNGGGTSTSTSTTSSSSNIFAATAAISILNFQFGGGYELGTIASGQRRGFLTIAYSIPLTSLVKGGFLITHKKAKPASEISDNLQLN